jgi:chromate transporter
MTISHPDPVDPDQAAAGQRVSDLRGAPLTARAPFSFRPGGVLEVLGVALRLGLTSFGGPIAHLGYFREEYVVRRRWLDEQTYVDLVALCQFLPGPASSQVGISVGVLRAGPLGGLAAWLGFTLPSAIALTIFAYVVDWLHVADSGWLHGLKVVAVAVVAQAVWNMARQFCTDRTRATIAILAALVVLAAPSALGQVLVIAGAALIGRRLFAPGAGSAPAQVHVPITHRAGIISLILFFALLGCLPLLRVLAPGGSLALFDSFYRVGSLVFGGGHVVLPLLQAEVVPTGWLTNDQFVAGYGAAQAVPGPLFTFAAYLGAGRHTTPNGVIGAVIGLLAIYLPSFLLLGAALPFWATLRRQPALQGALRGINAAVVGILLAALYTPVWTSAIQGPADFGLAVAACALLMVWKLPPWCVVIFSALGGALLAALS